MCEGHCLRQLLLFLVGVVEQFKAGLVDRDRECAHSSWSPWRGSDECPKQLGPADSIEHLPKTECRVVVDQGIQPKQLALLPVRACCCPKVTRLVKRGDAAAITAGHFDDVKKVASDDDEGKGRGWL